MQVGPHAGPLQWVYAAWLRAHTCNTGLLLRSGPQDAADCRETGQVRGSGGTGNRTVQHRKQRRQPRPVVRGAFRHPLLPACWLGLFVCLLVFPERQRACPCVPPQKPVTARAGQGQRAGRVASACHPSIPALAGAGSQIPTLSASWPQCLLLTPRFCSDHTHGCVEPSGRPSQRPPAAAPSPQSMCFVGQGVGEGLSEGAEQVSAQESRAVTA